MQQGLAGGERAEARTVVATRRGPVSDRRCPSGTAREVLTSTAEHLSIPAVDVNDSTPQHVRTGLLWRDSPLWQGGKQGGRHAMLESPETAPDLGVGIQCALVRAAGGHGLRPDR